MGQNCSITLHYTPLQVYSFQIMSTMFLDLATLIMSIKLKYFKVLAQRAET